MSCPVCDDPTHSVAWFALAAILLVATDLSEDHHHLKQISSTYFAQNDNNGADTRAIGHCVNYLEAACNLFNRPWWWESSHWAEGLTEGASAKKP